MKIVNNKVVIEYARFTRQSFAVAVGVYPQTVDYWIRYRGLDLDQSPYEVIKQFWNMRTECTECGKQTKPGMQSERWCPHCGTERLKIGITYYVHYYTGNDDDQNNNRGVTSDKPFKTTSKAMCRSRFFNDNIIYLTKIVPSELLESQ